MHEPKLQVGINATALLSPKTGIGQYIYHLGREFIEGGEVEPIFFYAHRWEKTLRSQPSPNFTAVKGGVKRFLPKSYDVARFVMQKFFSAGASKRPLSLYHEPNYLAFKFSGSSVVTAHDASWVRHPETHPADRLDAIARYFPRSLAAASAILTDSEFVKRELVELFGVAPEKVFPVLLGVSSEFSPRSPAECNGFLVKHGLAFGQYVLSVGTLEPRKNIPALIDAYSMLPHDLQVQFPLVLVGMRGWLTSDLEVRMKPLVERGVIRPLGYVPDADMPLIYSAAGAFVFPSLYEGFGLPPLEAMACGVPVISSQTSSLPEVVGEAGILIDPVNVDEIAETMHRVLEDRALAQQLSQAGVLRAKTFSWQRTAEQTIRVYRHALSV